MKSFFITVMIFCFSLSVHASTKVEVQGLFSSKAVVSVNGKRHILAVGETSPEGVKLISADSHSAILEVDGQQKQYSLSSISSISATFKKRKKLQKKIYVNPAGMYMTTGRINSRSVKFLVDTGASAVSMNTEQADDLGIVYDKTGKHITVSTASGFVDAYQVQLKSISVGGITQANVEALVISGKHPGPILLGMTFLSRLDVVQSGNAMTLTQTLKQVE